MVATLLVVCCCHVVVFSMSYIYCALFTFVLLFRSVFLFFFPFQSFSLLLFKGLRTENVTCVELLKAHNGKINEYILIDWAGWDFQGRFCDGYTAGKQKNYLTYFAKIKVVSWPNKQLIRKHFLGHSSWMNWNWDDL